jgi:hypothetical protein
MKDFGTRVARKDTDGVCFSLKEIFTKENTKITYDTVSTGQIRFISEMSAAFAQKNFAPGPGSYIWKDGRTYVGHYKDDLRDGEGVFCYPSGEKYEGSFFRGQRNGFGVFTFDAGQYKGEWLSGKYHGKGKLDWDPGMSYEGEFQGGLFKGAGTLKDSTGKILQQGDWVEGELITSLANGNEEKEGRSQKEMSDADCGPADATPLEQAPVLDTHANPDPLSPVNQAPKAIETVTSHTLNKRVGEITFSDVLIVD